MNYITEERQYTFSDSDKFEDSSLEKEDNWEYFENKSTKNVVEQSFSEDMLLSPVLDKCDVENMAENVAAAPIIKSNKLISKWSLYYHLPNDKNWTLSSYKPILDNIDTIEQLIAVNEGLTDNIMKHCMLFVMRVGITPMWEDKKNRNGGCFSYKVVNKSVPIIWRELMYLLCGNSLTLNKKHMNFVNGITISPKRGFCIVKIWLTDCSLQDPSIIVPIPLLSKMGCLFKSHTPEY